MCPVLDKHVVFWILQYTQELVKALVPSHPTPTPQSHSPAFPPWPLHVCCLPQLRILLLLLLWVFVCLFFPISISLLVSQCFGGNSSTETLLIEFWGIWNKEKPLLSFGETPVRSKQKNTVLWKQDHSAPSKARDTNTVNTGCFEVNHHTSGGGGK